MPETPRRLGSRRSPICGITAIEQNTNLGYGIVMGFNSSRDPSLSGLCPIESAVTAMAATSAEGRGAVYTRREVVEFILDLVGYTVDQPLHRFRLLEPSMGHADFVLPALERLLDAYDLSRQRGDIVKVLGDCLCGVELNGDSFDATRDLVRKALIGRGVASQAATELCDRWLRKGDFLLLPMASGFTHVIGNPPYLRQELIPDVLMSEYRRRFSTIYDRADIYVPFIERSLSLLAPSGVLGFICADRWMKNRYGGPLRRFVANGFHLRYYVDMVDTEPFLSDVVAYPAIFVIGREMGGSTRVAYRPTIDGAALRDLARQLTAPKMKEGGGVTDLPRVASSAEPWMLDISQEVEVMRRIEATYPALEDTGCKVGIGVATGADHVFIGPLDALDVEADRKLPLAMTKDIETGIVQWRGLGVINPFGPDGKLVPLSDYPKLAAYLEQHSAAIKARHVSKKNPTGWYRTIDRIYPELTAVPKLLIPDIKGKAHIVYEPGQLYPHHNLYFITSSEWNLHALQAVLLSDVTRAFITLYSTKMRGGYLRFQAQYLRRLRVPYWQNVPANLQRALMQAGKSRDRIACNSAVAKLYSLSEAELQALTMPVMEGADAA
jgi:hypothetical protein